MDLSETLSSQSTNAHSFHSDCNGIRMENLPKIDQGAVLKKQRSAAATIVKCSFDEKCTCGNCQGLQLCMIESARHLTSRVESLFKLTTTLMVIIVVLAILLARVQCRVSELERILSIRDHSQTQSKSFQTNGAYGGAEGFTPERLDRMDEGHVDRPTDQRSGFQEVRVPDELSRRGRRSTEDARRCSNLSIRGVLENYCRTEKYGPVLAEEAFFPTVFDDNLHIEIERSQSQHSNCLIRGTSENPESWCLGRTIAFNKSDSTVRVFSEGEGDIISFNKNSGTFTVEQSGTFLIYGSIPINSVKFHNQLLGLYNNVNNQPMLTCPSSGHGLVRPDNVPGSKRRRTCNFNGVMMLKKGQQLSLKTMENDLELHLTLPAYLSWILLSTGSNRYEWKVDRLQKLSSPQDSP